MSVLTELFLAVPFSFQFNYCQSFWAEILFHEIIFLSSFIMTFLVVPKLSRHVWDFFFNFCVSAMSFNTLAYLKELT